MTPAPLVTTRRIETGTGHHYETADGTRVPGVTTFLGGGIPKPALVPWAANTAAAFAVDHWDDLAKLPPSAKLDRIKREWRGVRDRAAARGTQVHAYAEALQSGPVDVPPELTPYVEPVARFLDEWAVEPVRTEAVVLSADPTYAGTLDMIADLADRKRWIIDYKTSAKAVYPETALQLAAYRWADYIQTADGQTWEPMPEVDRAAVVRLPGDGTYEFIPVETGPAVFGVVVAAHLIAHWTTSQHARQAVGRHLPPPPRLAVVQEPA